jgi:thiol:disulfide interchange protein DsbC
MKFYSRSLVAAALLGGFSLAACSAGTGKPPAPAVSADATAQAPKSAIPGETAVRNALHSLSPKSTIQSVRSSPITGFLEVVVDGDTIYISTDGKYLISGNIIDIASKTNLTEASRAVGRRAELQKITPSQMIVFAPAHPKYTVTVFTDVDCGYCRKLHSQIADYNKQGIAVDYLFFPRTGIGSESYDKAVSVWCSPDRRQALTDAKKGMPLTKANCTNPVTMDYKLGERIGVDGTPAIFAADGTQIGGYLPPAEMRAKLDALAAKPDT